MMKQLLTISLLFLSSLLSSNSMAGSVNEVSPEAEESPVRTVVTGNQPTLMQSLSLMAISALLGSASPEVPAAELPASEMAEPITSLQDDSSTMDTILLAAFSAVTSTVESTLADAWDTGDNIGSSEEDPFEQYNRMMFRFNSVLDEKAMRPLAERYRKHTPALVRAGVSNFFSNIGDVGVVANDALQGKFEQALWDTSRLTINTVAGLGGVIDVATMLDIEKNKEDFGQTFGVWGIPEGPYIVLPVLGPRTVRSAVGTALDTYLQAEALGAVSQMGAGQDIVTEMMALNLVNQREKMLGKEDLLSEAALDPYIFTREAYLAYRRCQVEDCDKIDYKPAAVEGSIDELDELDQLDELDLLDELDQLDQLDELDSMDESFDESAQ